MASSRVSYVATAPRGCVAGPAGLGMALKAGRAAASAAAAARLAHAFGRLPTAISLGRAGGAGATLTIKASEEGSEEDNKKKSGRLEKTNRQFNKQSDRQFKNQYRAWLAWGWGWALGWGFYIHIIFRFYIFLKTIRCILGASLDPRAQLGDFL